MHQTTMLKTLFSLCAPALWLACSAAQAVTCPNNLPPSNPDSIYTVPGDGTVTDTRTGLVWKQCLEGQSGADCGTGSATPMTWANALAHAESHNFAGHSDWRLPNVKELQSLVENCRTGPSINDHVFRNQPSSNVWSGSPDAGRSNSAWSVGFYYGSASGNGYRSNDPYVRLVRGGQSFAPLPTTITASVPVVTSAPSGQANTFVFTVTLSRPLAAGEYVALNFDDQNGGWYGEAQPGGQVRMACSGTTCTLERELDQPGLRSFRAGVFSVSGQRVGEWSAHSTCTLPECTEASAPAKVYIETDATRYGANDLLNVYVSASNTLDSRKYDLFTALVTPDNKVFYEKRYMDFSEGVVYMLQDFEVPNIEGWLHYYVDLPLQGVPAGRWYAVAALVERGERKITSMDFAKFHIDPTAPHLKDAPLGTGASVRATRAASVARSAAYTPIYAPSEAFVEIQKKINFKKLETTYRFLKKGSEIYNKVKNSYAFYQETSALVDNYVAWKSDSNIKNYADDLLAINLLLKTLNAVKSGDIGISSVDEKSFTDAVKGIYKHVVRQRKTIADIQGYVEDVRINLKTPGVIDIVWDDLKALPSMKFSAKLIPVSCQISDNYSYDPTNCINSLKNGGIDVQLAVNGVPVAPNAVDWPNSGNVVARIGYAPVGLYILRIQDLSNPSAQYNYPVLLDKSNDWDEKIILHK